MSELLKIAKENGAYIFKVANEDGTRTASCLMLSGIELLSTINAYNATQPAKIPDEVFAYIARLENAAHAHDVLTDCDFEFDELASKPESLK